MMIDSTKIPSKMSGTVLKLLCELRDAEDRKETLTMSELSKILGICTAGMTCAQDSATAAGWVTSRHAACDRWKKFLELTRAGLELVEGLRPEAVGSGLSAEAGRKEAA
jgi:DNA-binding MarR family transcriptional regulator